MIDFLNWLNGVLWGLPLIVLMVATGLYFTIRSGCFQGHMAGQLQHFPQHIPNCRFIIHKQNGCQFTSPGYKYIIGTPRKM